MGRGARTGPFNSGPRRSAHRHRPRRLEAGGSARPRLRRRRWRRPAPTRPGCRRGPAGDVGGERAGPSRAGLGPGPFARPPAGHVLCWRS